MNCDFYEYIILARLGWFYAPGNRNPRRKGSAARKKLQQNCIWGKIAAFEDVPAAEAVSFQIQTKA